MKQYIFLLIIFSANLLSAQQKTNLFFRNSTLTTSGNLPFWLYANQNGKFEESTQFLNLSELNAETAGIIGNSKWSYRVETNLIAGLANENYFRANQLFGGLQYTKFILKAGWFPNKTRYNGLSSANGDIHWSNNIRPLPRIRLQSDEFISFSFFPHWFFVKGLYEEGFLNDENRYVQNTHLHHKDVHFGFQLNPRTFLSIGLDHYSQWGGVHPIRGQLPESWDAYKRYIANGAGSKDFPVSDQRSAAGNQLGKFVITLDKTFKTGNLNLYYNHPFTDRMDWVNWRDNFIGAFYETKQQKFISGILYEFMCTKYQSAKKYEDGWKIPPGSGNESYFVHGLYKSGLSYHNRMFVTPFAIPVMIVEGVNLGTGNNRIVLHHIGINGHLSQNFQWKSLLSYSINHGTYGQRYHKLVPGFFDSPRRQISAMAQISWNIPHTKWSLQGTAAADKGQLLTDNIGAQLSIQYQLF